MGKLQGKVAVITGGTSGIGLATAQLFVREGAQVFITGRRQKELDEAVEAIGRNVIGVQGDVSNLADLDRLYETVARKGRVGLKNSRRDYALSSVEFELLTRPKSYHFGITREKGTARL
jgi:NAD(P)-dependent dehydrogenase (short-subunit alcohol dehydrogenase family)